MRDASTIVLPRGTKSRESPEKVARGPRFLRSVKMSKTAHRRKYVIPQNLRRSPGMGQRSDCGPGFLFRLPYDRAGRVLLCVWTELDCLYSVHKHMANCREPQNRVKDFTLHKQDRTTKLWSIKYPGGWRVMLFPLSYIRAILLFLSP